MRPPAPLLSLILNFLARALDVLAGAVGGVFTGRGSRSEHGRKSDQHKDSFHARWYVLHGLASTLLDRPKQSGHPLRMAAVKLTRAAVALALNPKSARGT